MTVAADRVQKVLTPRAADVEYERIRPTYPDTVEGQWALAEWCREHALSAAVREPHLRRVIELDPNHVQARRALGYVPIDGQWTRPKDLMESRGLKPYHGQYLTPQEIELRRTQTPDGSRRGRVDEKAEDSGASRIGGSRDQQVRDSIRAIHEPAATKALGLALRDDTDVGVRLLVADTLSRSILPRRPRPWRMLRSTTKRTKSARPAWTIFNPKSAPR